MSHGSTREGESIGYICINIDISLLTYLSISKGICYRGLLNTVLGAAQAVFVSGAGAWRSQDSQEENLRHRQEAHKDGLKPESILVASSHPAEAGAFVMELNTHTSDKLKENSGEGASAGPAAGPPGMTWISREATMCVNHKTAVASLLLQKSCKILPCDPPYEEIYKKNSWKCRSQTSQAGSLQSHHRGHGMQLGVRTPRAVCSLNPLIQTHLFTWPWVGKHCSHSLNGFLSSHGRIEHPEIKHYGAW